jgi:hypothetical protein
MAAAEPTLSRKEHLDAKRAFDRVKQHPVTDGDGPLIEYKAADGTMKTMTQVSKGTVVQYRKGFYVYSSTQEGHFNRRDLGMSPFPPRPHLPFVPDCLGRPPAASAAARRRAPPAERGRQHTDQVRGRKSDA